MWLDSSLPWGLDRYLVKASFGYVCRMAGVARVGVGPGSGWDITFVAGSRRCPRRSGSGLIPGSGDSPRSSSRSTCPDVFGVCRVCPFRSWWPAWPREPPTRITGARVFRHHHLADKAGQKTNTPGPRSSRQPRYRKDRQRRHPRGVPWGCPQSPRGRRCGDHNQTGIPN